MQKTLICFALILSLGSIYETRAEGFDVGLGLGFVDSSNTDTFDGGWDVQVGYEFKKFENWNFGAQLHIIDGLTSKSDVDEDKAFGVEDSTMMAYDSQALYLTARPQNWWLQFKVGLVHADYYTVNKDENSVGLAIGVGLVTPSDIIRFHALDYHRYHVGGESFNSVSLSFLILLAPAVH